ncbi:hypothetical protein GO611_23240, partial [Azoarcus communis SWub3 = DSM 12120]|nr:hypothetical protein [Parazoarcus communis SWub3 = DSM 12120]
MPWLQSIRNWLADGPVAGCPHRERAVNRLIRLLLTLLACSLLAACEAKPWDKDKDMNVMHLGAFKLDLQLEFPESSHRAVVLSALEGHLDTLNLQEVQSLIDKPGVKYYVTPLMLAVWAQNIDSTTWLLKHGANPNYRAPKGDGYRNPLANDSPLHYAVNLGNLKLATLLFDFGANPNLFGLVDPIFFETMDLGRGDG